MRTFELAGDEATLHLEGEPPEISAPHFGWEYHAKLQGHSLQVGLSVDDDNPAAFAEFFDSIAKDWKGWSETRGYESLDGTLRIAATHDRVGSVRFEVRLRADASSGFDWSVTHRLTVDARQLAKVATAAREFSA